MFLRTGESEYEATIAATGDKIIEEKLIGEPLPIDPKIYRKGSYISASECTEILAENTPPLRFNIL